MNNQINEQNKRYCDYDYASNYFTREDNDTHPEAWLRPTMSTPTPWKNRRDRGEIVSITSPSNVYIEYNDNDSYSNQLVHKKCAGNNVNMPNNKDSSMQKCTDFPKIKNTIFEDSLEHQEICFYLVDSDLDCQSEHYVENDYDSFESDVNSEKSFESSESDVEFYEEYNEFPKLPNVPQYGIIKFAGRHIKKLRTSIDLSESLSRIIKRKSHIDSVGSTSGQLIAFNFINLKKSKESTKTEKGELIKRRFGDENTSELRTKEILTTLPKNTDTTYENTPVPNAVKETLAVDREEEGLGFFQKIRRSMSISSKSVIGRSSNGTNRCRSTFYLTEAISANDGNETSSLCNDNTNMSLNVIQSRSSPSPTPPKNTDKKEPKEKIKDISISTKTNVITENIHINEERMNKDGNNYNTTNSYSDNMNFSKYDENKLNGTSTNVGNIQMLLHDEPLYQIYNAAVLKAICQEGTFQFEKDEKVKDNLCEPESSLNTYSLDPVLLKKSDKSFTKTLWCEIPEVIQSSVLSNLSIRQRKLQEAKFEIITSEASYMNSLNVLINHFALNMKTNDCIHKKEWKTIFGDIMSVKTCSEQLLHELEECWQDNILLYGICDIIQKHSETKFNIYISYCAGQIMLRNTLEQLMERPNFANYVKDLESNSSCQFLSLYSFLMLPVQRITRWPLLIDAVLKRLSKLDPEYVICQCALASLNKIVNQCNEAARRKEREMELQTIASKLKFSKGITPVNIISENRWLIRSGVVTTIQPKCTQSKLTFGKRLSKYHLYLYLFNDLFLVTKEQSNGTYTILHYCPKNVVALTDTNFSLPENEMRARNFLFLTILENQDGKTIEYALSCNKESDKERWIEAISPPKSEDSEETLYERWDCPQVTVIHNYISKQPDELPLFQGDIINVFRKMIDGWYYGERIRDGQAGWFPSNYTSEIINPHVRARNLKQRYRLLAFSESYVMSG